MGPITPISFKGKRYYISFTNNYIRFTIAIPSITALAETVVIVDVIVDAELT